MYRAVYVFSLQCFHELVSGALVSVRVEGYAEVTVAWLDLGRYLLGGYSMRARNYEALRSPSS